MISTKITRVAHRASCAAAQPSSTAVHRSTSCFASRQTHQRRHSSSKASCPPDNSPSGGKPAPTAKAEESLADPASQQQRTKRVTRPKRQKNAVTTNKSGDQFAGLPAVPGTSHLRDADLAVSSFFSLHRPLSLSTTIPPVTTADAFERIFQKPKEVDPWQNGNSAERRPEDVVYALGSLFDNLDSSANDAQDENVQWQVLAENQRNHGPITHLDGPPRQKSLDEMIAEFKPFNPPPPPQPFPAQDQAQVQTRAAEKKKVASKTRQKSYETKITFTEYTSASGRTAFFASSSPVVEIANPEELASVPVPASEETQSRFPFRQRMIERERASIQRIKDKMQDQRSTQRLKMMLISVKRQRKLKMKKHKYKKLMKRTRNLRRRQDRA